MYSLDIRRLSVAAEHHVIVKISAIPLATIFFKLFLSFHSALHFWNNISGIRHQNLHYEPK